MSKGETTVRLENRVHKELKDYCKENGHTKVWFISRAVEEKLNALRSDEVQKHGE